jgi:Gas vesicle synthesis protein GvpO
VDSRRPVDRDRRDPRTREPERREPERRGREMRERERPVPRRREPARPEPESREPESREPESRERAGSGARGPSGEKAARLAADHVATMTGKEPEGIVSLERADRGGWVIGVEVVETRRIPDSTDVLAVYEAELDAEGELVAYRRVKRYSRCQVGER